MATAVHVERTTLSDDNHAVAHDDGGETIRLAYDPAQTSEAAALAWLCLRTPRLISEGLHIIR